MTMPAQRDEARRQQALLAAIDAADSGADGLHLTERGERARFGLEAYRANARGLAERALAAAFPTVQALLGAADFARMAHEHWLANPPRRGDIAEWGDDLPAWLETHAQLAQWPYLADCARLDLMRHRCERAPDTPVDAASLAALETEDPARLRLVLMPGLAVLASRWPVVRIFEAHAGAGEGFDAVRTALVGRCGEAALVARNGWRAQVHRIDAATLGWTRDVLGELPLAQALERAGVAFDFTAWLTLALRQGWLQGVARIADR
jgi:Putative DNA-binding domain